MAPRHTDDERTSLGSGNTVLELSFSVADMIKQTTKLEARLERMEEKSDLQHDQTREAFRGQISSLRTEIKQDYPTRAELAAVQKTADGAAASINKVAWTVITAVIVALLALVVGASRIIAL